MVNVRIITDNEYLRIGLQTLFKTLRSDAALLFSHGEDTAHHYYKDDIAIIHLKPGDIYACNLSLKYRKKNRQLIFIVDKKNVPNGLLYPCLKDAIFIAENVEISRYAALLDVALDKAHGDTAVESAECGFCNFKYLTPSQLLILNAIKFDHSVPEISRALDIKPTTIYSQLKRVKRNFGILSNIDLYNFIQRINLSCNSQLLKAHNIFIFTLNTMIFMQ